MYESQLIVHEARLKYYRDNGLPANGGETHKWVRVQFGPLPIFFPNTYGRRKALIRHDLHHIANDCDTSLIGEGIVAAWELGRGCGPHLVAWFLQMQALWWGILFAPRQAFRAFLKGRQGRNLYLEDNAHRWLNHSVAELRGHLFPEKAGTEVSWKDRFHYLFLALAGLMIFILALPFYALPITVVAVIGYFFF